MDDAVKRVREHPLRPFGSRTGTWTARRAIELLLDRSLDLNSSESATLLRRWGRLHAVRSAASLVAFLIFVFLLVR